MSNRQHRREREPRRFVVTQSHVTQGLGHEYEVTADRVAKMDPLAGVAPGEHLWIMTCAFRVHPPVKPMALMDTENLINVAGPGCLVCEQVWTVELGALPCPGDPSSR